MGNNRTDDFETFELADNESMWIKVWEVNSKDRYWACMKCMCPAPDNNGSQYKMRKCPACGRTMRNGVVSRSRS